MNTTKLLFRTFFIATVILSLCGCKDHATDGQANSFTQTSIGFLPDSLFVLKNWNSSDIDSASMVNAVEMDSICNEKIVGAILVGEKLLTSPDQVKGRLHGRFISKQNKLGVYTPIILAVNGDDYGAIFYALLDSNLRPVSYFRMQGGLSAGPDEVTDSTVVLPRNRHSLIKGLSIHTYDLIETDWMDSLKNYIDIDSINFSTQIDEKTGRITTRQLDSVRYKRIILSDKQGVVLR